MLSEFAGSALSSSAQQVLASTASTLVNQGLTSMTATEAAVGTSLGQITQANTSMSTQMTILQTQVGNLDNVDANSVATQLNTLTNSDRDRLPNHRAAPKAQPRAISSRLTNVGPQMFEFAYNDIVDDSPQAMRAQRGSRAGSGAGPVTRGVDEGTRLARGGDGAVPVAPVMERLPRRSQQPG